MISGTTGEAGHNGTGARTEAGRPDEPDDAAVGGPEDEGGPDGGGRRWTPARLVLTAIVVALVAMWGYVLFLAIGPGRQPPIDRLDDPAFAEAGEIRCAEAVDEVGDLPEANTAASAAERADVVAVANGVFGEMLDDLDGMVDLAPAGDQRRRATEWLADWRTYLGDREAYAAALRADPEARLLVSEKPGEGRQITGWIDEFAKANRMPSCITPTDV